MNSAAAVAVPALLLALTVSGVAVIAGLRRRWDLLERKSGLVTPVRLELGQVPLAGDAVDIASEATGLLERFESFAAARFVTLETAVAPNLSVRMDPRALREILSDLLARAIETSPGGRVLLTAADVAGRVQVTVSDDGARADRDVRASWLRSAQRLAALQGATMDIDARSGQGTTVIVRIPASSVDSRRPASAPAALDPASVWSARQRAHEDSSAGR